MTYKEYGKTELTKIPAYSLSSFKVISKHTRLTGNMAPEAFLTPGGWIDRKYDLTKLNAKVYAKGKDGTIYPADIDERGLYEVVVPSDFSYTIFAEIPGHITQVKNVMGGIVADGEYRGIYWRDNPGDNLAGDVTGDQIIDIRDLKEAVNHYGENNPDNINLDLNQDRMVNETDVRFIEKNFLSKGQSAGTGGINFLKKNGLEPKE